MIGIPRSILWSVGVGAVMILAEIGTATTGSAQGSTAAPPARQPISPIKKSKAREYNRPDTSIVFDLLNPRSFTTFTELATDGTAYVVAEPITVDGEVSASGALLGRKAHEDVAPEIDRDSKILISFDRDWLTRHLKDADLNLYVEAKVPNPAGDRKLEVPGYGLVGEMAAPATVALRSTRVLSGLTGALLEDWRTMAKHIAGTMDDAGLNGDAFRGEVVEGDAFDQAIVRVVDQKHTKANDKELSEKLIEPMVERFLSLAPRLKYTIDKLLDTQNTAPLEAVARTENLDVEVIRSEGRQLTTILDGLEATKANKAYDRKALVTLSTTWEVLTRLASLGLSQNSDAAIVANIKDTSILVPISGAKVGDDLVISVINGDRNSANKRTFVVRMRVRAFGLVREITDAALFIRRVGIDERGNQALRDQAAAQSEATGTVQTVETPDAVNYVPAPGATLGWTLREREGGFIRFLEPGFGINVLFMRFGSQVATFTPGTGTSPPTATFQESSSDLHVGAGVIASLFGNALQATYGWDLNALSNRGYFGLGFSFVRVLRAASEVKNGE